MADPIAQQSVEALLKEEIDLFGPMPPAGAVELPLLGLVLAVNRLRLHGEEPSLWYWLIGISLSFFWLLWMSKKIIATDDKGGYPVLVRQARHDRPAWYVNGTNPRLVFSFFLFPLLNLVQLSSPLLHFCAVVYLIYGLVNILVKLNRHKQLSLWLHEALGPETDEVVKPIKMLHQIDSAGLYVLQALPWWMIRVEQSPHGYIAHVWKPDSPRFREVGLSQGKVKVYRYLRPLVQRLVWSQHQKNRVDKQVRL